MMIDEKENDKERAAKAMLKNQIAKCTIYGFITRFGGAIIMLVSIPANMNSIFCSDDNDSLHYLYGRNYLSSD